MTTQNEKQVIICEYCKGHGTVERSELEDYHRGEYRYWYELCYKCKGSGRMLKTVVINTTIEPYNNPKIAELTFEKLKGD